MGLGTILIHRLFCKFTMSNEGYNTIMQALPKYAAEFPQLQPHFYVCCTGA